jgi:hypothetical protein
MASVLLRLPAEDIAAFFVAVDAAARHIKTTNPDDPRTLEQIRADLSWSAWQAGHLGCCNPSRGHVSMRLGTKRGRAAHVAVTVPVSTLRGVDDQPAHLGGTGRSPPRSPAGAPLTASGGGFSPTRTDTVLDCGTTRYTPSADLADFIVVRDRTCRFPTCTWPANSCDADHTVPADDGGPTAEGNLGPLHRSHHIDKTHHGWRLGQPEPGRFVWTSPPAQA